MIKMASLQARESLDQIKELLKLISLGEKKKEKVFLSTKMVSDTKETMRMMKKMGKVQYSRNKESLHIQEK